MVTVPRPESARDPVPAPGLDPAPEPRHTIHPAAALLARVAASLIILQGATVVFTWHARVPSVVHFGADVPAVRYNAGICLALYGVSLAAASTRRRRSAAMTALAGFALSAATLLEYTAGWDAGIDDVFGTWRTAGAESARMAPNTALCLALAGMALLVSGWRRTAAAEILTPLLASTGGGVAAVALAGYIMGVPDAYAWGAVTPMAPATAFALTLLATGTLLLLWRTPAPRYGPRWLPIPVAAAVLTSAAILGVGIATHQRTTAQEWLQVLVNNIAGDIQRDIEHQRDGLSMLRAQLAADGTAAEWRRISEAFRAAHPALLAVELRGTRDEPLVSIGEPRAIQVLRREPAPRPVTAGIDRLRLAAGVPLPPTVIVNTDAGLGRRSTLVGLFNLSTMIDPYAVEQARFGRELVVTAGATVVVARASEKPPEMRALASTATVRVGQLDLRVRLTPSPDGPVAQARSAMRPASLIGGGAMVGALLGLVILLAQATLERNAKLREDVARRAIVERELRHTSRALERAQHLAQLGSWEWSPATGQWTASCEVFRILDLPVPSDLRIDRQRFLECVHPADRQRLGIAMDRTLRDGTPFSLYHQVVRPDGAVRIVHAQAEVAAQPSTGALVLIGTMHDVTEQRQAVETVERSERLLNLVLESLPVGVIITDRDGRPTRFNAAAREIWRVEAAPASVEEAVYKGWFAESGQRIQYAEWTLVRALRSGRPVLGEILEIESFDGEKKTVCNSGVPICDRAGEIVGGIVVVEDVTRRFRAEQELRDKTRALERSNEELEQFAYVASHDLQEPLRMISSYTQLLGRRYAAALDDNAREFIGYAVDGAERMQRLINDLLAYSRVGTRGAPMTGTSAAEVAAQALANLTVATSESGAAVQVDALPDVSADPVQLLQLFQNLIGNALKFRGPDPPQIRVSATVEDGMVRFAVADNGIGIDPAHAGRIFVIFQRLHPRGRYPGTGIGLAICKKIVQRHGGRIWVESEPGRGSTFYFTMPLAQGRTGEPCMESAA